MKVSVIGQVYPFKGGISHYNSHLCNELMKHAELQVVSFTRIFPAFIYPVKTQKDPHSPNFFKGRAEYLIDMVNPLTWLKAVKKISQFQPSFLLFHWYTPVLAIPFYVMLSLIKRRVGCKVIAVCHNVLPHERRFFDKFLSELVFKKVDYFVAHSEKDRQTLAEWMPSAKALAMFHPIYDFFKKDVGRADAQRKLGISGDVILFFGAIRTYKGLVYLLRALAEVIKKRLVRSGKVTLVIAGEFFHDQKPYLEEIERLGITPYVKIFDRYIPNDEVADYFAAADVLVAPYISGTQSGVITIAYAFEKPVIATDVGGFHEVVAPGRTGYLVPPADSVKLAEAILDFYARDKNLFLPGIREINRKLSWESLGKRIMEEIILKQ